MLYELCAAPTTREDAQNLVDFVLRKTAALSDDARSLALATRAMTSAARSCSKLGGDGLTGGDVSASDSDGHDSSSTNEVSEEHVVGRRMCKLDPGLKLTGFKV